MMPGVKMQIEKGIPYENLSVGDEARFSKTISEYDIYQFSGITGDFNPVHVNEEYAKTTQFKSRIAHGPLTLSLIAPVLGTRLPGLGTVALEISCRFKAPVYIGDTITARAMVSEKLEEKKWVRLTLVWTNHKNEIVAEGNALVMPPPGI
jgi:3-hydroxybutyryl-CoA dehydratase